LLVSIKVFFLISLVSSVLDMSCNILFVAVCSFRTESFIVSCSYLCIPTTQTLRFLSRVCGRWKFLVISILPKRKLLLWPVGCSGNAVWNLFLWTTIR